MTWCIPLPENLLKDISHQSLHQLYIHKNRLDSPYLLDARRSISYFVCILILNNSISHRSVKTTCLSLLEFSLSNIDSEMKFKLGCVSTAAGGEVRSE